MVQNQLVVTAYWLIALTLQSIFFGSPVMLSSRPYNTNDIAPHTAIVFFNRDQICFNTIEL